MSWSEPGFGFFGRGFWGRRVLWDNVPVQQRLMDAEGRLEQLLGAYGDELEAFLAAISLLPAQRDPHLARAATGEAEWFYVAALERWADPTWGDVLRLRGEADPAALPPTILTFAAAGYAGCALGDIGLPVAGADTGNGGTLVGYDNVARTWRVSRATAADAFDAAEPVSVVGGTGAGITVGDTPLADPQYPWFSYTPICNVARWWTVALPAVDDATGSEDPATYEVALVRTRNFDPVAQYAAARSRANEVWVRGGDLALPFQHPDGWILTGNAATDAGPFGSGVPIGVGDGTASPPLALPGPRVRLQANVTDPAGPPWLTAGARLVVDVPLQGGGTVRLYDAPDPAPAVEVGQLYPVDPLDVLKLDLTQPLGAVDYLAGLVTLDLAPLGWFALFDAPITAHWQARGYYVSFLPPRTLDHLARDYGFDNDRNDPEDRQRAAIAHLWQYFGCKGAQEAYRIRGEISLFDAHVCALWRLCSADLADTLPSDHVWEYGGTFYTDLDPRSLRFDDIRGDEQYYDTFHHETPAPAPPEWLTLVDRARLYEDAGAEDGMSAALAFALDVTQGCHAPVSETDPVLRGAATVLASTALPAAEAASLGLAAAWRVNVQMMRCQAEAFHFTRGKFGLTEYDYVGCVPPALADPVFWIDYEESPWTLSGAVPGFPDQDVGTWTVIIGVGVDAATGLPLPGPTVGADVAVRYWPELDTGDCCYCRSYKVRVEIEPKVEAYTYYETEAAMQAAVERLKGKILDKLLPIHVRVAEWVVTTEWTITMGAVRTGWTDTRVLDPDAWGDLGPSGKILLTIEQRGALAAFGAVQTLTIENGGGPLIGPLVTPLVGFVDLVVWHPVVSAGPITPITWTARDVTADLAGEVGTSVIATGAVPVTDGDVRWTFRVTRGTLG